MEDQKVGLLDGAPGERSSMRVAMIVSVIVALATWSAACGIAVWRGTALDSQIVLGTVGILGMALGGKAVQSFAEKK